jgi:hypothetical protein
MELGWFLYPLGQRLARSNLAQGSWLIDESPAMPFLSSPVGLRGRGKSWLPVNHAFGALVGSCESYPFYLADTHLSAFGHN